jgi:hypothetical protein
MLMAAPTIRGRRIIALLLISPHCHRGSCSSNETTQTLDLTVMRMKKRSRLSFQGNTFLVVVDRRGISSSFLCQPSLVLDHYVTNREFMRPAELLGSKKDIDKALVPLREFGIKIGDLPGDGAWVRISDRAHVADFLVVILDLVFMGDWRCPTRSLPARVGWGAIPPARVTALFIPSIKLLHVYS